MKKIVSSLVCIVMIFQCGAYSASASPARQMCSVSAQHAAIVELKSGRLIGGKAENERASMASTTKIMTSLLLCENADLDEEITVTEKMTAVEGTSMGLMPGDKVHYRDLLYGMLLASGNDAANAAAISIAGSIENFARMMNSRAAQIGMKNTNFVTPSGLDEEQHYSTAYDMALLACEAMKNADFAAACASSRATLEYGNPPYKRTLTNHNKLLKMYEDCVGIKTGFTKKSGRCLVSCAVRDGKGVVAVTLNAPDDWNDHIAMLDYGLGELETRQLSVPQLNTVRVVGGTKPSVSVSAAAPDASLLPEDFERVTAHIYIQDILFAPISEGETVGSIEWRLDGVTVAGTDITAVSSVPSKYDSDRRNYKYWLKRMLSA